MPTIEKGIHGQWIVSDIIGGYWVSRQYYFFTTSEAIAAFKRETGN